MGKGNVAALLMAGIIAIAVIAFYILQQEDLVEERTTTKIAAFNIQGFGGSKRQNEDVMAVLTEIAREFDVLLVQEIRDSSEQTAQYFLERINGMEGPKYNFIRSERLGRTTYKEAYAYFYNSETVKFIQGSDYVYDDVNDVFEREPYIASFKSGNFDFILVGVHIKPDDAKHEIGNLTLVVQSIRGAIPYEKDIIVMGDLNADGSYFDEDDALSPFKASEFYWIITNNMNTMTKTDYTYDRIVILNATLHHEYVDGSAGVFYFDQQYGINNATLINEISDHYPVFAEYKTNLADDD